MGRGFVRRSDTDSVENGVFCSRNHVHFRTMRTLFPFRLLFNLANCLYIAHSAKPLGVRDASAGASFRTTFTQDFMSVFKYIFDSDWSQRSDIEALKRQNQTLTDRLQNKRATVAENEARIAELEEEVGELALICKTLMQVMLENQICTGRDIEDALRRIDAKDGVVDGKVTKEQPVELKECPQCGRPVQHHHTHCVYCGHQYPQ